MGQLVMFSFVSDIVDKAEELSIGELAESAFGKDHCDMVRKLLHESASDAIRALSASGGYLENDLVKIPLPEDLQGIESLASTFGMDEVFQEFVVRMNRAAESAANASLPIFENFISELTIENISQMISDQGSPATDLFRTRCESELTAAYTPIIESAMDEYSVSRYVQQVLDVIEKLPGVGGPDFDLQTYTINQALSGLFRMLSEQEDSIRKNPSERMQELVGDILKPSA